MNRSILTLLSFWLVACGGPAFTALELPAAATLGDAGAIEADAGAAPDAREVLVDAGDAPDAREVLVDAGDAPDAREILVDAGGSPDAPVCNPSACAACKSPEIACCSSGGGCGCLLLGVCR